MPSPALLAIALVLFSLLLAPTRRLQVAGWSPRALGAYLLAMLLLGLSLAYLPISARFLAPILVVGYLAPFVTVRSGLDRLRRVRRSGVTVERPPIKVVSGPVRDLPSDGETEDVDSVDVADTPGEPDEAISRPPGGDPS